VQSESMAFLLAFGKLEIDCIWGANQKGSLQRFPMDKWRTWIHCLETVKAFTQRPISLFSSDEGSSTSGRNEVRLLGGPSTLRSLRFEETLFLVLGLKMGRFLKTRNIFPFPQTYTPWLS
jgi:hypothetical protein